MTEVGDRTPFSVQCGAVYRVDWRLRDEELMASPDYEGKSEDIVSFTSLQSLDKLKGKQLGYLINLSCSCCVHSFSSVVHFWPLALFACTLPVAVISQDSVLWLTSGFQMRADVRFWMSDLDVRFQILGCEMKGILRASRLPRLFRLL